MTDTVNIKDLVKNTYCHFAYLRCGQAYYTLHQGGFMYTFPVEISDLGNATINTQEKGMTMMRYIRKAIEANTLQSEKVEF